jgi:hypothetical protein
MLKSARKFGFNQGYQDFFSDTSNSVHSAILKNTSGCHNEETCITWATWYQNISTILDNFIVEYYHLIGNWIDENNRPLLCQLEDGVIRTYGYVFLVSNVGRFLELNSHLQTAFYLLMLGYVKALACFVTNHAAQLQIQETWTNRYNHVSQI